MHRVLLAGFVMMGVSTAAWAHDDRWPGSPRVGLRAGLTGSTATPGLDVGNVGIKALLNDRLALLGDVGLSVESVGRRADTSFTLGGGLAFYLLDTSRHLRPYIPFTMSFGVVSAQSSSAFQMAFASGLGAEYFFAKQFSLSAEMLLRVHIFNLEPVSLRIGTFAPGVHATYYF